MNREIVLSVKRSQFRCDDPTSDESDAEFQKIRPEILKRDNNTCQFCGFRAEKFQEAHHLDDNHSNNDPSNLITACCLCHACHHIGLSGSMKKGILISLDPSLGISQADLNQLVRVLWIGEQSKSPDVSMSCMSMLSRLHKANVPAKREFGSSDPSVLSDFLLALDDEKYSQRQKYMKDIFFFPLKEFFKGHVSYWSKEVFHQFKPNTWVDASEQKLRRWSDSLYGSSAESDIAKLLRDRD